VGPVERRVYEDETRPIPPAEHARSESEIHGRKTGVWWLTNKRNQSKIQINSGKDSYTKLFRKDVRAQISWRKYITWEKESY